jgi:hypothetical protein
MLKNKKGLSAVITMLITILLVLVAVGIVWVVVQDIIEGGVEEAGTKAECFNFDVKAVKVINTTATNYQISIKRNPGGDEIGGVKLVISNSTDTSNIVYTDAGNLEVLGTRVAEADFGITDANKIETTVYLLDDSGNEQICSQTTTFKF